MCVRNFRNINTQRSIHFNSIGNNSHFFRRRRWCIVASVASRRVGWNVDLFDVRRSTSMNFRSIDRRVVLGDLFSRDDKFWPMEEPSTTEILRYIERMPCLPSPCMTKQRHFLARPPKGSYARWPSEAQQKKSRQSKWDYTYRVKKYRLSIRDETQKSKKSWLSKWD